MALPVCEPAYPQKKGDPYVYYHQIQYVETKTSGLRMSACLSAMDDARTELFAICDQSVSTMRQVDDPMTDIAIEICPALLELGRVKTKDGLLYSHPDSKGPVRQWLRIEARFGFPVFPLRSEEQTIFLVGKNKDAQQRISVAHGQFTQAFVDNNAQPPKALMGDEWEKDVNKFFAQVKEDHGTLQEVPRFLHKRYQSKGKVFTPTVFKKVTWLLSHSYGDAMDLLYHGKCPELMWDLNMLAGGPFQDLVTPDGSKQAEPDPQAMAASLAKKMEVGTVYDAFCFQDERAKKCVYLLVPEGGTRPQEVVLALFANYNWQSAPDDGRTLTSEDVEVISAAGRNGLVQYGAAASGNKGPEVKTTKVLDLSLVKNMR
eukprot:gnl/TRDRNA2_/TRDRNA2_84876_c0_seq1.p1 gnl/TRDRNA2_/TRDRNA2_84876_c0~~gnl/TRDRNA2_/TRDRNA2_84876_c0_seq1.p1  ORF type:complete len:373 (-),score=75.97 gnl/TRDRNA2_/TRDRNA2_84876_c0_seq1:197-1315(-)